MATKITVNNKDYFFPDIAGSVVVSPQYGAGDLNTPVYISSDGVPKPIAHYNGKVESAKKIQVNKNSNVGTFYLTYVVEGSNGVQALKIAPNITVTTNKTSDRSGHKHTHLALGSVDDAGSLMLLDGGLEGYWGMIKPKGLTDNREYLLPDEDGTFAITHKGNDYAEFRKSDENIQPGRVVKEIGDGRLELATKRLDRGCEIVSDVYAFSIGKSEENILPIAAAGRVLAYPDADSSTFEIGAPVCSGENGTVSQMTEEEERMYPSRIIGTVSEIPTYDTWNNIPVNGRIWIRIR